MDEREIRSRRGKRRGKRRRRTGMRSVGGGPLYYPSTTVVIPWWKLLWRRLMGGGNGLGFGGPYSGLGDLPDTGMYQITQQVGQQNGISGMLGGIGGAGSRGGFTSNEVTTVTQANEYSAGDVVDVLGHQVIVTSATPQTFTFSSPRGSFSDQAWNSINLSMPGARVAYGNGAAQAIAINERVDALYQRYYAGTDGRYVEISNPAVKVEAVEPPRSIEEAAKPPARKFRKHVDE